MFLNSIDFDFHIQCRLNPVTRKHEPYVPIRRKAIRFTFTSGVVLVMVGLQNFWLLD